MGKKSNRKKVSSTELQQISEDYNLKSSFEKIKNGQFNQSQTSTQDASPFNANSQYFQQKIQNSDTILTSSGSSDLSRVQSEITRIVSEFHSTINSNKKETDDSIKEKLNISTFWKVISFGIPALIALIWALSYGPYLNKVDKNSDKIDTISRKIDMHLHDIEMGKKIIKN